MPQTSRRASKRHRRSGVKGRKYRAHTSLTGAIIPQNEDAAFRTHLDVIKPEIVVSIARTNAVKAAHSFLRSLAEVDATIVTAESLTAGMIMSTLVDIPELGFKKYGCFGVYSTSAKERFLGVEVHKESWKNIKQVDAVYTHRCAAQMAIGALINSTASFAISTTGQAMPMSMKESTLGKVHIGFAVYVDKNFIPAPVHDCPSPRICVHVIEIDAMQKAPYIATQWKQRPQQERELMQAYGPNMPPWIDGFNDIGITSIVSQIARYFTTSTALHYAQIYMKSLMRGRRPEMGKMSEMRKVHTLTYQGFEIYCDSSIDTNPLFKVENRGGKPIHVDTSDTAAIRDVWPSEC